jgi:hypothetical protein
MITFLLYDQYQYAFSAPQLLMAWLSLLQSTVGSNTVTGS